MYAAVALIALALGYKVYVDACREKEGLKLLGQAIGILVMLGAILSIACGAAKCAYMAKKSFYQKNCCAMTARAVCPVSAGMSGQ